MSDFKKYLDDYDRTALGAGSSKGTDRLSAKDVGEMFRGRGDLSAQEGAQGVLDYFAENKNDTKHGGATARAIEKMGRIAGRTFDKDSEVSDPNPGIELSQRAAEAVAAPMTYSAAQGSGLLSRMRGLGGGEQARGSADAFTEYKDMYKGNLKKALSKNAGIEAGATNDMGIAGGGQFMWNTDENKQKVADLVVGKQAGLNILDL